MAADTQVSAREQGSGEKAAGLESLFSALKPRHIGPLGNRVIAVTGVPGKPNDYFIGSASGGIFRSIDGGHAWQPIFDDTPASSIGSLAVAPSDANVVWAGTGETFIRSNVSIGDGIYRSVDGGDTWQHRGLDKTGRIGRVIVHRDDPNIVWAAALGHGYGPQQERGVYKTTDGGDTWRRVLFVDENTGASDLVSDPNNPRILFAGFWQLAMNGSGRTSGGPGSSLWRSADGGESWSQLEGKGLPAAPWGKIGLGMSAADSRRIYALIETSSNSEFLGTDGEESEPSSYAGTLWRSDDAGSSWNMVNADNTLHQRPLYYTRLLPAPDDADEVHFMATQHSLSKDGGRSIQSLASGYDHHDVWIDPQDAKRMIVGHDGGVSISTDRGRSWYRPQLPIAQMYRVAVDDEIPYRVYGNRQDGAALRGPSRTLSGGSIPLGAWSSVGGCEVGWSLPQPDDSEVVWSTCYDGILERYDARSGQVRDVSVWPEAMESWPASQVRYRFTWSYPIAFSPHEPRTIYAGSHVLHSSQDDGQTWREISGDLTSGAPELMARTGGLTLDDAGPTIAPSLFAIAESPLEAGRLWTGSNDGRLHTSADGGQTWSDVSDGLKGLPPLGTISSIEPSRHRPEVVYVTVDRHREADTEAHIYRSQNRGQSWQRISDGIDGGVLSYVHCLREDPQRPGLLYAGTEGGLWWSLDDGDTWRRFESTLPPAPIYWIEVQESFGDLVLATYGRGFWILDDLSPLRQMAPAHLHLAPQGSADRDSQRQDSVATAELAPRLFEPRSAYRFRRRPAAMEQPGDPAAGSNPPAGTPLNFWLPNSVDGAELEIFDSQGQLVRGLDAGKSAGFHRVWWDLFGEPSHSPKLRTRPEQRPDQQLPAVGWRSLPDGGPIRLLARPGLYTIRLTVEIDGQENVFEQALELQADPGSKATDSEVEAQYRVLEDLRRLADRSAKLIDEIEWQRKQLGDLKARLDSLEDEREGLEEVSAAIEALNSSLLELEGQFFDLRLSGARQDTLRWRRLLWARLGYLAGRVAQADAAPTRSQLEVHEMLRQRVDSALSRFEQLTGDELPRLQQLLDEYRLSGLILDSSALRGDS